MAALLSRTPPCRVLQRRRSAEQPSSSTRSTVAADFAAAGRKSNLGECVKSRSVGKTGRFPNLPHSPDALDFELPKPKQATGGDIATSTLGAAAIPVCFQSN